MRGFRKNKEPTKSADTATKCVMLGYGHSTKAYRLYHPVTKKAFHSRDVTFDEGRRWKDKAEVGTKDVEIGVSAGSWGDLKPPGKDVLQFEDDKDRDSPALIPIHDHPARPDIEAEPKVPKPTEDVQDESYLKREVRAQVDWQVHRQVKEDRVEQGEVVDDEEDSEVDDLVGEATNSQSGRNYPNRPQWKVPSGDHTPKTH